MSNPLADFYQFMAMVKGRLNAGRATYGDTSFSLPPLQLLEEIQAEILDICGWSFILWERVERLRLKSLAEVASGRNSKAGP